MGGWWRELRSLRCLVVVAALLSVALAAPSVRAQTDVARKDRHEALKLGGEALDLFEAGDYEAALDKFTGADELVDAPTLKLHMARCLDKLDRMKEAAEKYREIIATELKAWAPAVHRKARKQAVPELAALLEATPKMTVTVQGPGSETAEVTMEGELFPSDLLGEKKAMDPGHYRFQARSGDRAVSKEVDVERGAHVRVVLELTAVDADGTNPHDGGTPNDNARLYRIIGWSAVGIGAAGLVMGTVAGIVVLNKESDLEERCPDRKCSPEVHDDARSFDTARAVSTAGFIIAGVGAAAGVTLLLLAPGQEQPAAAGLQPFVTFGGLGLRGSF